jgi:acyl dehydratase
MYSPLRKGLRRVAVSSFGRCFEDFAVGDLYRHPLGRTITETDNVWFTALTMNTNQLHFNNDYSTDGLYGRPLVVSTLTLAVVTGLSVLDVSQHAVANLGWDEVRMPAPVFVGDTLYADSRVEEVRESTKRPTVGIVTVRTRGINQEGTVVVTFRRSVMVAKRGHETRRFPVPTVDQ